MGGQGELMQRHERARASLGWAREHLAEVSLVLFGILLRVAQVRNHAPQVGYDFCEHEATVIWWTEHFRMPPFLLSRGSYHPQLYYMLGGVIRRLGGGWMAVQGLSVGCGCIRLCLIWFAGLRHLPTRRTARIVMLALAAVMPAAVQLEGMMTQESSSNLLSVVFIIAVLELGRAPMDRRRSRAIALGMVAGFGLLLKVSNLVLLGVLLVAPVFEIAGNEALALSERIRRARAWALAAMVALGLSAGQYAYNHFEYGQAIIDGWYKRPTADTDNVGAHRIETLDRRTLGFFLGFTTDIVRFPYYPSGIEPTPRLWPLLIASSFSDYFNYSFAPASDVGYPLLAVSRSVGERATTLARASIAGGLIIASVSVVGWIAALVRLLRRREIARPIVLLLPAMGALGQMSFATKNPYDFEGVVKGIYFQFAAAPLYAVFGAAVAWLFTVPKLVPLAMVAILSIMPVAAYTTYCVLW
jgi:hypothetical protein